MVGSVVADAPSAPSVFDQVGAVSCFDTVGVATVMVSSALAVWT